MVAFGRLLKMPFGQDGLGVLLLFKFILFFRTVPGCGLEVKISNIQGMTSNADNCEEMKNFKNTIKGFFKNGICRIYRKDTKFEKGITNRNAFSVFKNIENLYLESNSL